MAPDHVRRAAPAICALLVVSIGMITIAPLAAAAPPELTSNKVLESIAQGQRFLASTQHANGSFGSGGIGRGPYSTGPSALATLALLNSGLSARDRVVQSGLRFLRNAR